MVNGRCVFKHEVNIIKLAEIQELIPNAIESLQFELAHDALSSALSIDQYNSYTWFLAAKYLEEMGDIGEAIKIYRELIKIDPNNHQYNYQLGLNLFLLGEHHEALALFVYRADTLGVVSSPSQLSEIQSESGRMIYLTEEQGLGDQIMFLQFLHCLKPKENFITVEIDARLIPIYEIEFPSVKFIERNPNRSCAANSITVPLGDLFVAFFMRFLSGDKVRIIGKNMPSNIKAKVAEGKKIIGISWATVAKYGALKRSIPIDFILEQLDADKHHIVVLQYLAQKEDLEKISTAGFTFEQVEDGFSNIFDVARAIKECDLVATIDNYVLHLSGALGTKTLGLLPSSCSYRWGLKEETSFFYKNVALLRQARPTDWEAPLYDLRTTVKGLHFDN